MRKYVPGALHKTAVGRWAATKSDRYVRYLTLPSSRGPVRVRAHGSKQAQFASGYLSGLARWARTHKASELAEYEGKTIDGFELVTDPRTLRALRDAGLLQLDSLYAALKDVG